MANFIAFEKQGGEYEIVNKKHGDLLGRVTWYKPWRQWVAEFADAGVWSAGCLADVQAFLIQLNTNKRKEACDE